MWKDRKKNYLYEQRCVLNGAQRCEMACILFVKVVSLCKHFLHPTNSIRWTRNPSFIYTIRIQLFYRHIAIRGVKLHLVSEELSSSKMLFSHKNSVRLRPLTAIKTFMLFLYSLFLCLSLLFASDKRALFVSNGNNTKKKESKDGVSTDTPKRR